MNCGVVMPSYLKNDRLTTHRFGYKVSAAKPTKTGRSIRYAAQFFTILCHSDSFFKSRDLTFTKNTALQF
jgi:hypothetical protein